MNHRILRRLGAAVVLMLVLVAAAPGYAQDKVSTRLKWFCNPPIFSASQKRSYAAIISFCMGVMPPSAMFGRS